MSRRKEISPGIKSLVSKHPTSYKLTNTALGIVTYLSAKRGIAKSALIENLLRDEYQAEVEREKKDAWIKDRTR